MYGKYDSSLFFCCSHIWLQIYTHEWVHYDFARKYISNVISFYSIIWLLHILSNLKYVLYQMSSLWFSFLCRLLLVSSLYLNMYHTHKYYESFNSFFIFICYLAFYAICIHSRSTITGSKSNSCNITTGLVKWKTLMISYTTSPSLLCVAPLFFLAMTNIIKSVNDCDFLD